MYMHTENFEKFHPLLLNLKVLNYLFHRLHIIWEQTDFDSRKKLILKIICLIFY